jgi:hypothetical protein
LVTYQKYMTALHYQHVTRIIRSLGIRIRFDFLLSKQIFYTWMGKNRKVTQIAYCNTLHNGIYRGHYGCPKLNFIQINNLLRKIKYLRILGHEIIQSSGVLINVYTPT